MNLVAFSRTVLALLDLSQIESRALEPSSLFERLLSLRVVVLPTLILYVLFVPKNRKRTEFV